MAGYGNRTAAPNYDDASPFTTEHTTTRLNLTDSHSPPTYGAGFGNKRASQPSIPSLSPSTSRTDTDTNTPDNSTTTTTDSALPRFDTQTTHGSAPYSNAHTYGSASTAGAGWGNKTGSFSDEGEGQHDSVVGKVMQRIGGALHSPGLVRKGEVKRDDGGSGGV